MDVVARQVDAAAQEGSLPDADITTAKAVVASEF
jgi:hypothetical protein